ncbi:ABC transporter permease [Bacillota bacterium Meth-B3]|nr:ABC transporter permease [Christensenellaceae bacterium]MEA5067285.1 ABC transporter permease [Eubacteriales bacterium]MEA5068426.1 ABC transporter permease [Christensenellaceae bacterium]
MLEYISNFLYSVIRISTPIIFVAICSTISAQAGLLNMAGESMMLVASLSGVIFSAMFQNVWIGILCGMLMSMLITLILCFAAFVMKVDLYLMSISMNMALGGGVVFVMWVLTGTKANTAGAINGLALGNIDIPLIKDIPILGSILSGHNVFTYLAILMTVAVWFLLFRTKLGLRMRAIGQNPQAAESVGINTKKIYTIAFLIAAAVGAFGGMYLSMGYQNFFSKGLTGSRGFIGMAADTIGNSQPFGALVMSFVFGLAYAISNYLQPVINDSYLLMSIPFLLSTVIYLIISGYRSGAEGRRLKKKAQQLAKLEGRDRDR